jgi:uncharacterized cupredoxin-like copper-binding protein
MRRRIGIPGAIIGLALLLAACGGGESGPEQIAFTVNMTEYAFNPAVYNLPAGAEVTVTVVNDGVETHNFFIMQPGHEPALPFNEEAEADFILTGAEVEPGESGTFTFTAPAEVSTLAVVCGIAGHIESGMHAEMNIQDE